MRTLILLVLVSAFTSATVAKSKTQFTRYRSWNSRMYPVWRDGDSRFRNCWFGGEVTFDVKNDAPTLTGAKATFNIDLRFPTNQTVLPDGQVVWARNCTIDGTQYQEGQAVYADQDSNRGGVFPDGSPFAGRPNRTNYVYVWKTWGRYWQLADGPSSSLTIGTDNIPLGSYKMEVVIYHCRGKDKFIPLGYASTQFSVTDQIPFVLSLNQVNDVNQNDQNFIQNRAIAFNVKLHDPSQYLSGSDITFNWDFGDNSGTLISRELSVTHTYMEPGVFKPQVVLMASIPTGCADTAAVIPADASAAPVVVVMASTSNPIPVANPSAVDPQGDTTALEVPASEATLADDLALAASAQPADATDATANPDAEAATETAADGIVPEATEDADAVPAAEDPAIVAPTEVDTDAEDAQVANAVDVATAAPAAPAAEEAADAAAAPAAPAAEEPADAAAAPAAEEPADAAAAPAAEEPADAAAAPAAEEAADAAAAPADEIAVTDAPEVNVQVIDAATPAVPAEVEGEETAIVDGATAAPAAEDAAEQETVAADAAAVTEATQAVTAVPVDNVLLPAATESAEGAEVMPAEPEVNAEAEVIETVNEVAVPTGEAVPVEEEAEVAVEMDTETDPAQVVLVVAKRQAPELADNCMVYRYGSLATSVDIIQGIESVEIVQVANVVSLTTEMEQNAVDLTISCQGSLPSEVCTVISDADCVTPVETVCNAAMPSPDCQLILRQFFNDSGVFCINVSLTNDVSFAVASARVSVTVGSTGSPAGTAATVLGLMVLVGIVGTIGLMYRRFKQYQPLSEDSDGNGVSAITSVPLLLWNLLSRQSPGESRPLLQGRVV